MRGGAKGWSVAGRSMEQNHHAICRSCGTREDLDDAERRNGRMWQNLTCGCWQRAPGPGEMVLSMADGEVEVWDEFADRMGKVAESVEA